VSAARGAGATKRGTPARSGPGPVRTSTPRAGSANGRGPKPGSNGPSLEYRVARRGDIEALVELSLRTYRVSSAGRGATSWAIHGSDGMRVGGVGRRARGLARAIREAFVRGEKLPVTGIGSVAVSPEHRRRGIADQLLRATLHDMRERGDAWSMLYSFRGDFYRRFGWGLVETPTMLSVPPASLPASGEAQHVRRMRVPDRAHVQSLYDRLAKERGHFTLARKPAWWERRLWGYEGVARVRTAATRSRSYLQLRVDSGDGPWSWF
jgi:GNAT superfamily N-acetyltransferase